MHLLNWPIRVHDLQKSCRGVRWARECSLPNLTWCLGANVNIYMRFRRNHILLCSSDTWWQVHWPSDHLLLRARIIFCWIIWTRTQLTQRFIGIPESFWTKAWPKTKQGQETWVTKISFSDMGHTGCPRKNAPFKKEHFFWDTWWYICT